MRLPRPCLEPGCSALSEGSYCLEHRASAGRGGQSKARERDRIARREPIAGWKRISGKVLARDGYICHICGGPGADTADHLIPRSKGGSSSYANLAAAHRLCNSAKGDR